MSEPDIVQRIQNHIASFQRSKVRATGPTTVVMAAARVGDPIKHKSFFGALAGAVAGALIEGAVIGGCAFAFGGFGGFAVGMVLLNIPAVDSFINKVKSKVESFFESDAPDGFIIKGSSNVFVNGKPLAFAALENQDITVQCNNHDKQRIAMGSETVFVNGNPVARQGDKTTCDAVISEGSPNVFFGSGQGLYAEIEPEFSVLQRVALVAVEFLVPPTAAFRKGLTKGILQVGKAFATKGPRVGAQIAARKIARSVKNARAVKNFGCAKNAFKSEKGVARFTQAAKKWVKGDPIDILTGQIVEQRTDFTLGQTLPLSFVRTWARSKDERHADGLCGRYWVDNFSEYAEISGNGQHIKIATCEGTYLRFALPIGSLQSVNPDHPQFTLTRHRDFLELYDRELQFAKYFQISTARFAENNDDLGYPLLEDGRFRLSYWQDDFDNRVRFHYADTATSTSPSRLIQVSHSDGIELRLRYQGDWLHQIIRTDGEQQEVLATYQQDERGGLVESNALLDFHLFYDYDEAFNLTRWADNDKTWVRYEYDELGRCVHSIGADGFYPVWFQFEENRTTVYNGKRHATIYDYDSHLMLPLVITSPTGAVTQFEYDRYGNLLRQTLPDGNQLCFDYLEQTGLVTCFTDTLGNQWRYEYDEREQLCKLIDPIARVWTKTEEIAKNQAYQTACFTAPDSSQTTLIRNEFGLLTEVQSAMGKHQQAEHFHYDPRHRLIESQDSEQRHIQLGYNDKDQLTQFTNPNGKTWRYAYNAQHKLSRIDRPNHSHEQQAYDRHGNLIQYTDANGVIWQLKYGAFDLLTEKIDGEGNRWQYDYDKDSLKLCQVTNPKGETYRYRFNENEQILEEIDFADNRWLYAYYPNGSLQSLTDGEGNVTHYEYDQGNRLIRLMTSEDNITYEYDKIGRVTAIDTLYSHLTFEYDSLDRIVRETQNEHTITRTFDDENQTVTRRLYLQGKSESEAIETRFHYNTLGELIELNLPETSGQQNQLFCQYDDNGNEVERCSNHGFIYKQQFNEMDMPTQQRAGWEPKLFDKDALRASGIDAPTFAELNRTYRYDLAMNTIEAKDSQAQQQFYLNGNNQITHVNQQGNPSEIYAYDSCGYLTQQRQSPHGNLFAQVAQDKNRLVQNADIYKKGNQLNRLQDEHYSYDNAGRLIAKTQLKNGFRKQETHYRWNSHNQLTGLTNPQGEVWYYKYDGLGRRISKQCPEKRISIEYLWDGDQLAYTITEKNGKQESERHSIFNGWHLIAQQDYYSEFHQTADGNKTEWKHQTHYAVTQPNGQVLSLFDPEGKTSWYKPQTTLWGLDLDFDRYASPKPLNPNLLFAGQYFDEESGLAYNRFRYYDPETASYLCSDPIGLEGGGTPYGYVPNPIDWLDPFGLSSCRGLPSTRKAGGTGKDYDKVNGQGLYILRNPKTKKIEYVGRGDAPARVAKHQQSIDKGHLEQQILFPNNLTKAEAKYLEQALIDYLGGAKSTNPRTNLLNKIRSYSNSNPNATNYSIAGDSMNWAKEIFDDALKKL